MSLDHHDNIPECHYERQYRDMQMRDYIADKITSYCRGGNSRFHRAFTTFEDKARVAMHDPEHPDFEELIQYLHNGVPDGSFVAPIRQTLESVNSKDFRELIWCAIWIIHKNSGDHLRELCADHKSLDRALVAWGAELGKTYHAIQKEHLCDVSDEAMHEVAWWILNKVVNKRSELWYAGEKDIRL